MLPKPVNSVTDKEVARLEKAGCLAITRKRDGYRVWIVKDKVIKLYTRGLQEVTAYFAHIVKELEEIGLPQRTFLDGEMLFEKQGKDDFSALSRIFKLKNPREAINLQKQIGFARLMIFDVVFFNEEKWLDKPWSERYAKIKTLVSKASLRYVFSIEVLDCSFEEAQKLVKQKGWEGLVIYDIQGCSDFRLDGKVSRPRVAWKRKPVMEDDFIVRRWVPRENDAVTLKEFCLSQIDAETGKEIDCGKCGTGFSDEERRQLANDALYPLVAEIRFYERFPGGKLRFASFVRLRDDKKLGECILENI